MLDSKLRPIGSECLPSKWRAKILRPGAANKRLTAVDYDVVNQSTVAEIVDQMASKRIRWLVILCNDGNVCGLVSSEDPLQVLRNKLDVFCQLAERQLSRGSLDSMKG